MTIITRRVRAPRTEYGGFFWIGWGNTWGNTFRGLNAVPALVATRRVPGTAAGNQTSRIHHLLLLEGDQQESGSDYLLLEGDEQEGDDVLALSGDARDFGGTATRRVAL